MHFAQRRSKVHCLALLHKQDQNTRMSNSVHPWVTNIPVDHLKQNKFVNAKSYTLITIFYTVLLIC